MKGDGAFALCKEGTTQVLCTGTATPSLGTKLLVYASPTGENTSRNSRQDTELNTPFISQISSQIGVQVDSFIYMVTVIKALGMFLATSMQYAAIPQYKHGLEEHGLGCDRRH